jgi:hypothetical protein
MTFRLYLGFRQEYLRYRSAMKNTRQHIAPAALTIYAKLGEQYGMVDDIALAAADSYEIPLLDFDGR